MVVQNQYIAILYARRILLFNDYPYPTLLKIFFSVPEKDSVELRVGVSSEYHYGRYKRRAFFSDKATGDGGWWGGGTSKFLKWPIREDSSRKGYLFQASGISERQGISLFEVYERVGKSVYIFDL